MNALPVERAVKVVPPQFSQVYPACCKAPFPIAGFAEYRGLPGFLALGEGAG